MSELIYSSILDADGKVSLHGEIPSSSSSSNFSPVLNSREARKEDQIEKGVISVDHHDNYILNPRLAAIYRLVWSLTDKEREYLDVFSLYKTTPANFVDKVYDDNGNFERLKINDRGNSCFTNYMKTNSFLIEDNKAEIKWVLVSVRIHKLTNFYNCLVRVMRHLDFDGERIENLWE